MKHTIAVNTLELIPDLVNANGNFLRSPVGRAGIGYTGTEQRRPEIFKHYRSLYPVALIYTKHNAALVKTAVGFKIPFDGAGKIAGFAREKEMAIVFGKPVVQTLPEIGSGPAQNPHASFVERDVGGFIIPFKVAQLFQKH